MSSITTPKVYTFPTDTRHAGRKALLGVSNEMEMYYSGGVAYGEEAARNRVVEMFIFVKTVTE